MRSTLGAILVERVAEQLGRLSAHQWFETPGWGWLESIRSPQCVAVCVASLVLTVLPHVSESSPQYWAILKPALVYFGICQLAGKEISETTGLMLKQFLTHSYTHNGPQLISVQLCSKPSPSMPFLQRMHTHKHMYVCMSLKCT